MDSTLNSLLVYKSVTILYFLAAVTFNNIFQGIFMLALIFFFFRRFLWRLSFDIYTISGSFAEDDIGRQSMTISSAVGNATASRGLEVAVANLQEYCNGTKLATYLSIYHFYLLYFVRAVRRTLRISNPAIDVSSAG